MIMKKVIVILSALLLLSIATFAQTGKSIYEKYSDIKGVEAVYISPAMFRFVGTLPNTNIKTSSIRNFKGFYILSFSSGSKDPNVVRLSEDVRNMVRKGGYEKLMEAKEEGETTEMYGVVNADLCRSFVMIAKEEGETTFICIDADIYLSDLQRMAQQ